MPYQVGGYCYATTLDAGSPACAAFVPVTSLMGTALTTVGCSAVNGDATLKMYRSVADTSSATAVPVVTYFNQTLQYGDCQENAYLVAIEGIAGPFLALLVACWGLYRLAGYLGWGRSDSA